MKDVENVEKRSKWELDGWKKSVKEGEREAINVLLLSFLAASKEQFKTKAWKDTFDERGSI